MSLRNHALLASAPFWLLQCVKLEEFEQLTSLVEFMGSLNSSTPHSCNGNIKLLRLVGQAADFKT